MAHPASYLGFRRQKERRGGALRPHRRAAAGPALAGAAQRAPSACARREEERARGWREEGESRGRGREARAGAPPAAASWRPAGGAEEDGEQIRCRAFFLPEGSESEALYILCGLAPEQKLHDTERSRGKADGSEGGEEEAASGRIRSERSQPHDDRSNGRN